jgi:hypothetical protein
MEKIGARYMPSEVVRNGSNRARRAEVSWENPQVIAGAGKDYSG